MLEKIDLNQKLDKKTFKRIIPELRNRLYVVQKSSWDAGIPVIILYEGWDAAGKGTSIQMLTRPLDPRGYKLYPIRAARTYEKKHPWLWRFWSKLPARGEWAIFDRSWYGRVMVERVENLIPEAEWRRAFRDIVDFERTLADDGCQIIKFFLHISKSEQKRRFDKLSKDPMTSWQVTAEDWEHTAVMMIGFSLMKKPLNTRRQNGVPGRSSKQLTGVLPGLRSTRPSSTGFRTSWRLNSHR